ncbi:flagellar basal body-associated FliL family protein [Novosphingopyxis sp.]|uniref:flagellar basal body-associated FliL family protein n=1 Tax=Novosphingopyxis sp. TaxID=2709690 RepID=UPI003B5A71BD
MSDEKPPKKKGKLKKLMLPLAGIVVIGGAGGAGGYFYSGMMGGHEKGEEKPELPKLVLKDGSTVDAPASGKLANKAKYKVTYHPIEESFTSNLRGGSGFAQAEMAVSTFYDESVIEALTEHDIAVRNAIVLELADTDGTALETIEGKTELAHRLCDRINQTLEQKTGFGGIDEVYFTKLVLQ